jgi:beta-lactamase superfamily II metal-dependent hydrolase
MRATWLLLAAFSGLAAFAQGSLQIHFIDAGQGDTALLVSPQGEAVLFDNGVSGLCDRAVSYIEQLGITAIQYHIASHYHSDHIGCTNEVLSVFPLKIAGFDRGGAYYSATYKRYLAAVAPLRRTAQPGGTITLDQGSSFPVRIVIVAANGTTESDGVHTTNENDLSVVAVVHYGSFDAVLGGDLSGYKTGSYEDIETPVAPRSGRWRCIKFTTMLAATARTTLG